MCPTYACGWQVGNAVKFTREGGVTITVCLERPDMPRDRSYPKFVPVAAPGAKHFYVRVQVRIPLALSSNAYLG